MRPDAVLTWTLELGDLDADRNVVTASTKLGSARVVDNDDMPAIGDLIGGKFRIAETIGEGGMGVVLAAEHVDLRQAVAIKMLRPALAKEPDALARFLREARAAASIKSQHAVRIHDVGTTELGTPYMVMERLRGIGVDALLERESVLPVAQAVRIAIEAAEAVAEAHRIGIVHRDLKPSNLFLAIDESGAEVVKVLDFGISKRVTLDEAEASASLTAPQTLLGSPQYMSPEQLRDPRSVDARADVWGLGVTLYELLTGHAPFESTSIPELCALIFNATPTRASAWRPEVPASLSDLLERCLAKAPGDRIASVEVLARELAALDGASVPLRRAPRRVALAALAAVVLVVVILFVRARGETARVERPVSAGPSVTASPSLSVASPPPVEVKEEASAAPRPSSPVPSAPPSLRAAPTAPRPSGLKGIKLLD